QTQKALAIPAPLAPYALITRPVPTPGAGDVLVKVQSIGLNPAENVVRTEAGSWVLQEYPALTGTDGAGTVVKLGEGVIGWEVGDRVLFQG
ncbi:GroES-like protein, partial [Athelia psychrophila]